MRKRETKGPKAAKVAPSVEVPEGLLWLGTHYEAWVLRVDGPVDRDFVVSAFGLPEQAESWGRSEVRKRGEKKFRLLVVERTRTLVDRSTIHL